MLIPKVTKDDINSQMQIFLMASVWIRTREKKAANIKNDAAIIMSAGNESVCRLPAEYFPPTIIFFSISTYIPTATRINEIVA